MVQHDQIVTGACKPLQRDAMNPDRAVVNGRLAERFHSLQPVEAKTSQPGQQGAIAATHIQNARIQGQMEKPAIQPPGQFVFFGCSKLTSPPSKFRRPSWCSVNWPRKKYRVR